jgi:hypothetical protein
MKISTCFAKGCSILFAACFLLPYVVAAQHKDLMGGSWNNPVSASIANMVNDRIYARLYAKARARRKAGNSSAAPEPRESDLEPQRKSAAQIAAATRFRSTGTQLTTRDLANASGNTPEEKEQMFKIMGAALTAYQAEERRLGRQNDFALALAVALAANSNVYHGKPEPEEARLLEIGDVIGELMAEENILGGISDRQKQEMYETMVIFTMLVQLGSNEAKQNGDSAGLETYRQLAAKVLTSISGMPPEKIRLDSDGAAMVADNPSRQPNEPAAPARTMHAAALVKEFESNEVRANGLYAGKRMRIHGTVNNIEIDNDGKIVLTFKSSVSTYNNARCYFSKSQSSRVAGLSANMEATVEGTVRGLGGGFDGTKAFVLLDNCIVP